MKAKKWVLDNEEDVQYMNKKEITGFKPRYNNDSDSICPNCRHEEWIGLTGDEGIFVSKKYNYYTCSKCGCQWKIEK